jgi:LCP family protein required for cell wall assembly
MQYLIACTIAACIGFIAADLISSLWYAQRIYTNLGLISVATPTATAPPATATPLPVTATPVVTPSPAVVDQPAMTVLLLGSDRRPQENTPARTDAVMVMRIDPQQQRIALLSLPRDLMVNIPGYGWSRINAANVYGDIYPSLGGGMALATQTVSQVIGQPIDYTVRVDFAGFIAAIDTLTGVPVQVTNDLYDDRFPTMDYQYTTVSFQVGETVMDGSTALVYSRIRHPDSDFARMARQQQVITGIAKRLQSGGFLETLATTANITDALVGHAQTTMPRDTIVSVAWAMRTTPLTNFSYHVFNEISYGSGNDRYAMYANAGAIERIVQQWLGNP